jgi:hypothetical protein
MTSFENKVPQYLSMGSHHKVVRMDESNFNCVSNWSDWDEAESGFRAKLDEELIVFKTSHQERIEEVERQRLRLITWPSCLSLSLSRSSKAL